MKKLFLFLAAVFGSSLTIQAQNASFGAKLGVNLSNLAGSDVPDAYKMKVGGLGGFMLNIPVTPDETFSVQPEVLYSMKGAQGNTDNFKNNLTLHYVDVPLLAKANLSGFLLELGPQANFLVALKNQVGTTTSTDKARYNTINFGATAGIGYEVDGGPSFELRYNRDITPIASDLANTTQHIYNSVFQFQVGLMFARSSSGNRQAYHRPHRRRRH